MKRIALWASYLVLVFATIGTTMGSRSFVKISFGPFYILEILLLLFVIVAFFADPQFNWKRAVQPLWPVILFFLWGTILLVMDVSRNDFHLTAYVRQRIAQHAILFVYPLAWMAVGFWAMNHFRRQWIFWLVIAMAILTRDVHNVSVGPLLTIPYMFFLMKGQQHEYSISRRRLFIGLAAVLGVLTFYPFWIMYTTSMQRTTLLIHIVLLFGVPWVLNVRGNILIPLRSIGLSFAVLLAGFVGISALRSPHPSIVALIHPTIATPPPPETPVSVKSVEEKVLSVNSSIPSKPIVNTPEAPKPLATPKPSLKSAIIIHGINSLEHGEDLPDAKNPRHFQFRTRGFMWKTAISDWREHPILGVGFIPEVPSYIRPGWLNNGGFVKSGDPPVTGPHNSYLSVLARMGLIGSALFVILAWHACLKMRWLIHAGPVGFTDLFLIFVPLNGAIHAVLNVGFESPHKCMIMWLFTGFLFARVGKVFPSNDNHSTFLEDLLLMKSPVSSQVVAAGVDRRG